MGIGEPSLRLALCSDVAEIRRLADALESFGVAHAIPAEIIGRFALASDELITNTILYGGPDLHIGVDLRLADGLLSMTIADDGRPFDPLCAPLPDITSDLADRRVGGLGVHIVIRLMDVVSYRLQDGLNKTTIAKVVSAQETAG